MTKHCQIYPDHHDHTKPVWIDTVGYDDTNNIDDEETFKNILKFIQEHELNKVKAIIWTVLPQERKDARLQRQANFINKFRYNFWYFVFVFIYHCREESIWNNVILIVKQPGPGLSSLERGCQGPEEAAKIFCPQGISQKRKLGFSYLDDSVPSDFKEVLESLGM